MGVAKGESLLAIVAIAILGVGCLLPVSVSRADPSLIGQEGGTQVEVFRGTIYSNGGRFVLRDESRKAWYELDDQRSAKPLEGKQVRIIGTLDASTRTIHVEIIEEDPVHSGFTPEPDHGTADTSSDLTGPTIIQALREQFSLKLEPANCPVNVFVLDHIVHPAPN